MCLVALFLMGSAVVFVGYWPDLYQGGQVRNLKRFLAFEIAYGRKKEEETGQIRFYGIKPGDENEYVRQLLQHHNVRVDFDPGQALHYFRFAVLEVSSVAVPALDHAEFLSG